MQTLAQKIENGIKMLLDKLVNFDSGQEYGNIWPLGAPPPRAAAPSAAPPRRAAGGAARPSSRACLAVLHLLPCR